MGEGAEVITVAQLDTNGVLSNAASLALQVDTRAPAAPSLLTPVIYGNNVVSISEAGQSVVLFGDREAGATVRLVFGGTVPDATASLQLANTSTRTPDRWSYTLTPADLALMARGTNTIGIIQTDAAGNDSEATNLVLTVNIAPPAAPTIIPIAKLSNGIDATSGLPVNSTSTNASSMLRGTAEIGSVVTVQFGDARRTTTTTADGTWSVRFTADDFRTMGEGPEVLTVFQTDTDGLVGASTSITVVVDTTGPSTFSVNRIATDNTINLAERNAGVSIMGFADLSVGSVSMVFSGAPANVIRRSASPVSGNAGFNFQYTLRNNDYLDMGQGDASVTVFYTDRDGNFISQVHLITIDTIAPSAATINPVSVDNVIGSTRSGRPHHRQPREQRRRHAAVWLPHTNHCGHRPDLELRADPGRHHKHGPGFGGLNSGADRPCRQRKPIGHPHHQRSGRLSACPNGRPRHQPGTACPRCKPAGCTTAFRRRQCSD